MCIAIYARPGSRIHPDNLDEAARCNDDGFGYAFVEDLGTPEARVVVKKAATWEELKDEFYADQERVGDVSGMLIHFRIATHGKVDAKRAHPFATRDGGAIIHNGIIPIPHIPGDKSDTEAWVRQVVDHLPDQWYMSDTWLEMAERMIGTGSKVAGIWPDGQVIILNERSGHWDEGVWYSNHSYKIRQPVRTGNSVPFSQSQSNPPATGTNTGTTGKPASGGHETRTSPDSRGAYLITVRATGANRLPVGRWIYHNGLYVKVPTVLPDGQELKWYYMLTDDLNLRRDNDGNLRVNEDSEEDDPIACAAG